jgi:outer membrane phospholipase A
MKKTARILVFILFMAGFTALASASEYESPMSLYKDNYFTAGSMTDQMKFQISAKYNIFYPSSTGLYFGYTQISWWKAYRDADTFSSNYQPECFYAIESKKNIFNDADLGIIDYLQVSPIQHSSTGIEGENHRSINIYYGQIQLSAGEVLNFGANVKVFGYYTCSDQNADFNDYRRNYEADFFFRLKSKSNWYVDKYELHLRCSGNPFGKGYYMAEGICQIFTAKIQPRLFVQFSDGYGVNMVCYNKKVRELRAGIIF